MRHLQKTKCPDDVRVLPRGMIGGRDWKETPADVLQIVDEQLEEHGLEVVIVKLGDETYVWRIEKR